MIEEDTKNHHLQEEQLQDFDIKCEKDLSRSCSCSNSSAISYKPSQTINEVEHSFEELAEMFDLLKVRSPEKIDDWTFRYVVEDSAGESEESLRFEMWSRDGIIIKENEGLTSDKLDSYKNVRDIDDKSLKPSPSCEDLDLLNLTEITTSTELSPQKTTINNNLKTRCMSLSLTHLNSLKISAEGLVRRRSLID